MTVRARHDGVIELTGRCTAEDAEALQRHLLAAPGAPVEWQACEHLHSAVAQVLLAARPPMHGTPQDDFLANHIAPILAGSAKAQNLGPRNNE